MRNANNGKWVTVQIGRGAGEIHARDCRLDEGRMGFYSKSTECGRHSARSAIRLHRDNVANEDLASLVTCEKCRRALGIE